MSTTARNIPAREPSAETTPLRFVTAASLFDGHDAAINIMRRLIQAQGVEVVHLGHNRSVEDVVRAALQEDADGIALSSYQGGHVEYFKYMVDMLKERGASHIKVFGGGGGTITPEEIAELQAYGVERIYHPNDGMHMGLVQMIEDVVRRAAPRGEGRGARGEGKAFAPTIDDEYSIGRALSAIERGEAPPKPQRTLAPRPSSLAPVLGLTGTGGAGKSSVVDELVLRFLQSFPQMRIAVLAVDPTRRRSGGALLGDRIRMNSLRSHRVFMRSMATRRQHVATNAVLKDCIAFLKGQGYDLVIVETAGIGQSDSEIVDLVDFPVYVMTSDYGAASQLEKIDMLDFAELVVLNKYDRRGAEDALRDVRKQWRRNRVAFKLPDEQVPVYPTIASQFNDPGVTWMFVNLCRLMREKLHLGASAHSGSMSRLGSEDKSAPSPPNPPLEGEGSKAGASAVLKSATRTEHSTPDEAALRPSPSRGGLGGDGVVSGKDSVAATSVAAPRCNFDPKLDTTLKEPRATVLIPGARVRYLAEIAEQGRGINSGIGRQAEAANRAQSFWQTLRELGDMKLHRELDLYDASDLHPHPGPLPPAGEGDKRTAHAYVSQSDASVTDPTGLRGEADALTSPSGRGGVDALTSPAGGRGRADLRLTFPLVGEVDARSAAGEGMAPKAPASPQSLPLSPTPLPQGERGSKDFTSPAGGRGRAEGAGEGGTSGNWRAGHAGEGGISADRSLLILRQKYNDAVKSLSSDALNLLREWPARLKSITDPHYLYEVRGKPVEGNNYVESMSHQSIPKIAAPTYTSWGELLTFLMKENLPGAYPYTGGIYPYRRTGEDPLRMFAGEGTPERTNRRFHYLSQGQKSTRLSTAFDSVTLYGEDPHPRPDIYGKIGNSGVNVPTLDDMKKLYSGFDLSSPSTSVSMTINGPAPIILAMFMNTAIDQNVERYLREDNARWDAANAKIAKLFEGKKRPTYTGDLPHGHNGLGLGLLGVTGDQLLAPETYAHIKAATLSAVRGTVQADILKEDQAQNTCIFSTEFALRMMGDIQQYFVDHKVRNFYSVSISGYHIAEAGANPISQLAFTLSNGFTIVEYYLARGMNIDDFAPNLSFFFSNGMDPEYSVIGRVSRRIWARAMRERYGASPRSQMMKYHIQTSGRSLHAQEIQFNDIRTTLQALYALFDNCNSLHTNAYDEAITTPTEESVRRAVAIQLIINRELGLNFCENPWQGSFIIDKLTDIVEEAVYKEFEAISERGGVLGAMDTMYQRGKIQEESMYYEHKKHDGSLPLIGVNTFLPKEHAGDIVTTIELIRSTEEEKNQQIANVEAFKANRNAVLTSPAGGRGRATGASEGGAALPPLPLAGEGRGEGGAGGGITAAPGSLGLLQQTARDRKNVFEQLMEAVKYNSEGQISHALYDVGGEYRRNM